MGSKGQQPKFDGPVGSKGHRRAAEIHSCIRLKQRYDVHGHDDQRRILRRHTERITGNGAELLGKWRDGSKIMRIVEEDVEFYPVWHVFGFIVTYLTKNQAYKRTGTEFLMT